MSLLIRRCSSSRPPLCLVCPRLIIAPFIWPAEKCCGSFNQLVFYMLIHFCSANGQKPCKWVRVVLASCWERVLQFNFCDTGFVHLITTGMCMHAYIHTHTDNIILWYLKTFSWYTTCVTICCLPIGCQKKKTCRKTDDSLIILLSNVCKYNLFNTENYEKFDYVKEYV